MKAKNFSCPQCGAALPTLDMQGFALCEYCFTRIRYSRKGHFFPYWEPTYYKKQEKRLSKQEIIQARKEIERLNFYVSNLRKYRRGFYNVILYVGISLLLLSIIIGEYISFLAMVWILYAVISFSIFIYWKNNYKFQYRIDNYRHKISEKEKKILSLEDDDKFH